MAARTPAQKQERRRRIVRRLGLSVVLVALGAAWLWQRTVPLERIAVVGAEHAPEAEIVALTQAEPDSVALFSLSPALLADRAQRHPWVESASVRRLPTGTLRIAVDEREPVVLVIENGRPAHFLDARGYAMPVSGARPALYDVPVLYGAPAFHPAQPVESAGLRSLLAALSRADDATLALVSEVEWGPRVTVWTTPVADHGSLAVRLGHDDHDRQLRSLRAFWDQAVLPSPNVRFASVDLRFEGQVVTREAGRTASSTPADSTLTPPASAPGPTSSPDAST